jgi:hypothetical protein
VTNLKEMNMPVRTAVLAVIFAFLASTGLGQSSKKETTIYGEVIDISSYVANTMKPDTPDRKALAEASAKGGNPLGILERGTAKIYVVTMKQANTGANETLLPYLGLRIFATGRVYKRGGIQLFVLSDIGKSVK